MQRKTIVIVANLDTRGEDFKLVKDLIEKRGHRALFLDFSMQGVPFYPGDITCEEVALRGGATSIEEVREFYTCERRKATEIMIRGASSIVREMYRNGEIQGIIGIGGATTSLVATTIMRQLPVGFPKLMTSSIAAHPAFVSDCVGTRDITMHNTIFDVVEMNPLLRRQIVKAVGAICGMVELLDAEPMEETRPLVAITSCGLLERCVQAAVGLMRDKGYEPVPCHAQGLGDRAMDEFIREGLFAGVIDLSPRGVAEQLFGGDCAAGDDRLLAASESGIPQVISLAGLDMLSHHGSVEDAAERFRGRTTFRYDEWRLEVRTSPEELVQVARVMAERLNKATAPATVLIPVQGWSWLSQPGRPFYDPEADAAFADEMKRLVKPQVSIKEVHLPLDTPEFAKIAVEEYHSLHTQHTR